ncbi:pyridoxal phosphate-dependent aminotransferase [Ruminococcaceae bacterium OttesenSCG-928-D13]|nr:pyridoxal phosphate-dependent aminotransferase [Ruminococcaceae bacterium OttesenSCG-928-D13]
MRISSKAQQIKPSAIRKMFNQALEYDNVISFTLGEPDFTAPPNVVQAAERALEEGKTKYSPNIGILELREAVSHRLAASHGLSYSPKDEIVITIGAMGALHLAMMCLLEEGDEVLISAPCWTNYIQIVTMCGGVPVLVPALEANDFVPDPAVLEEHITSRTRLILLNSPANPTGGVIDHDTLEKIAGLCVQHGLYVLSDEVYRTIAFDGVTVESIATFPQMQERTVVVDSFSKAYAMTGWRVGFAAAPRELVLEMTKLQENVSACCPTPCQYAAVEALSGPQQCIDAMNLQYKARRNLVIEQINRMPGLSCKTPKATFYAFVNITGTGLSSEDFAMQLLRQHQVVVVPGTAFGPQGEGYVRISYATSLEQITEGLDRIEAFVRGLKA